MERGPVSQYIEHHYRHFNAAALMDAAKAWEKHLDDGGKMLITLAGAMSTAELGLSLAELIRQDKVHAICCTGANLEEDICNLVAHDHYVRVPNYRDLTPEQEEEEDEEQQPRQSPPEGSGEGEPCCSRSPSSSRLGGSSRDCERARRPAPLFRSRRGGSSLRASGRQLRSTATPAAFRTSRLPATWTPTSDGGLRTLRIAWRRCSGS